MSPPQVEHALLQSHERDQAAIAVAFHPSPPAPSFSHIVNTVTPEEGAFLASYLGVPETNVCKVKCRGLYAGNRVHRELQNSLAAYFTDKKTDLAAVTFLGHMGSNEQGRPEFSRMSPEVLFELISDLRPRALNFFSCSSLTYAREVGKLFADNGTPVAKMACFADEVEVSQWPKRASKYRPLRMFYAGPELGYAHRTFSADEHKDVLPWVRELTFGNDNVLGAEGMNSR